MSNRPTTTEHTDPDGGPDSAADWVLRLQDDQAGESDWLAFDSWLARSPGNGIAYDRALALWHELDQAAPALKRRLGGVTLITWRMSAAAGALAAGLMIGWVLIAERPSAIAETYQTATGEQKNITLADGSRIDLAAASRMTVSLDQDTRRVSMERGEAIFDVAPDSARPFVIAAGDRAVRVVGTEFDVRRRDGAFSVTVRRGVVEVAPAGSAEGATVRLVAGDRVDHREGSADQRASKVSADEVFGWRSGRLVYRERPLSEVVADLNAQYARPVTLADPKAAALPFSGVLTLDDEETVVHRLTLLTSLWSTSSQTGYVLRSRETTGQ